MKALSLASMLMATGPAKATAIFNSVSLPFLRETTPEILAPTLSDLKLQ